MTTNITTPFNKAAGLPRPSAPPVDNDAPRTPAALGGDESTNAHDLFNSSVKGMEHTKIDLQLTVTLWHGEPLGDTCSMSNEAFRSLIYQ